MKKAIQFRLGLRLTACVTLASCGAGPPNDSQLSSALESGGTNVVQRYLAGGGNPNRQIKPRRFLKLSSPLLCVAVANNQIGVADLLLRSGADPNRADSLGETPLSSAASHAGPPDMLSLLLAHGADPNLNARAEGYTPLHYAAMFGSPEAVQALIKAGADINRASKLGERPLHLANRRAIALMLVRAGADPGARTAAGETPADVALRSGRRDLLNVLTNANK